MLKKPTVRGSISTMFIFLSKKQHKNTIYLKINVYVNIFLKKERQRKKNWLACICKNFSETKKEMKIIRVKQWQNEELSSWGTTVGGRNSNIYVCMIFDVWTMWTLFRN